jgi:hypothetical protein
MKDHLSSADLAIWIILIVSRGVLCYCILKRRLLRRLPLFSSYIFASTIESLILLAVAFLANYAVYYYVFYVTTHLISVMAFLTLLECARRVLPGLKLPQRKRAFGLLFAALTAVFAFAALWPLRSLVNEKRIEVAAYLAIAVTFIFVAGYSRYLGLYWSRLLAGLCTTLGCLYLLQGAAKAMINHYPSAMVLLVRQISQIANVLAVIAWIIVVLSPWGESVMTEEDLQTLEAAFAKIEDSLGAERVKAI